MKEQHHASGATTTAEPSGRQAKRPVEISERLKDWIVEHDLKPGDRLPQERDLMDMFKASKSTVREALGALQTQGLVRTRTGPRGGAYIAELDGRRAMELLGNYFFFSQPTISDIYALRKLLEPEMAASLVGRLEDADFERLRATIRLYDHPAANLGEESPAPRRARLPLRPSRALSQSRARILLRIPAESLAQPGDLPAHLWQAESLAARERAELPDPSARCAASRR
jgi:DNA-binding transcriptional MocR family regulator